MTWDNFRFTQMVEACEPRTLPPEVEDDTLRPRTTYTCNECKTVNHPEAIDMLEGAVHFDGWLCPVCGAPNEWE